MPGHCCPAKIGPSLTACDLANMAAEAQRVLDAGADYLHLDVMDAHFVPNLTWGAPVIKCLRQHVPHVQDAFFDCHMMVSKPEQWVDDIKDAGGDQYTFHLEATADPRSLIKQIREAGMKVGLALKPGTPVSACLDLVDLVDMVLVMMTVEPGFGGQKFMPEMMPKVQALRAQFPALDIEVDGGLGPGTVDMAARAGANMIVAGTAVFTGNPKQVIELLRRSVDEARTTTPKSGNPCSVG